MNVPVKQIGAISCNVTDILEESFGSIFTVAEDAEKLSAF